MGGVKILQLSKSKIWEGRELLRVLTGTILDESSIFFEGQDQFYGGGRESSPSSGVFSRRDVPPDLHGFVKGFYHHKTQAESHTLYGIKRVDFSCEKEGISSHYFPGRVTTICVISWEGGGKISLLLLLVESPYLWDKSLLQWNEFFSYVLCSITIPMWDRIWTPKDKLLLCICWPTCSQRIAYWVVSWADTYSSLCCA